MAATTTEAITLPLHPHKLTSFYTTLNFTKYSVCYICQGTLEGDGYMCLSCRDEDEDEFLVHKRCIQDLYYADGTKAPRVYHGHPLEILIGKDMGYRTCANCDSNDKSGEFIGCACCQVFYHRNCFQVPEILRYPSHNPDHTLVLFPDIGTQRLCQSCSSSFEDEIYYRCTLCDFFVHVRCALQVLAYCEEGMSGKIELSWHKHRLFLCNRTKSAYGCFYCGNGLIGPTYACEEEDCGFLLHERCSEIESTITHPHHPDHPLTLCKTDENDVISFVCKACGELSDGGVLGFRKRREPKFSCERCVFDLHVKCAARFPTHKHYLHEHKLLRFERVRSSKCNRCGRSTDSPVFRCVPCDFNLHEECMELPLVVKHKTHSHPLTLREFFREDDSGEYYCDLCEKRRDGRLGVYVCSVCERTMLDRPWAFHIECVLPELGRVYANKKSLLPSVFEKLSKQIEDKEEEVRSIKEKLEALKEKLEEATRDLDELVKQRDRV